MEKFILILLSVFVLSSCNNGSNDGTHGIPGIDTYWHVVKTTCNGVVTEGNPVVFNIRSNFDHPETFGFGTVIKTDIAACNYVATGSATFDGTTLTLVEDSHYWEGGACDPALLPPLVTRTGPATLNQFSLDFAYTDYRGQSCLTNLTR